MDMLILERTSRKSIEIKKAQSDSEDGCNDRSGGCVSDSMKQRCWWQRLELVATGRGDCGDKPSPECCSYSNSISHWTQEKSIKKDKPYQGTYEERNMFSQMIWNKKTQGADTESQNNHFKRIYDENCVVRDSHGDNPNGALEIAAKSLASSYSLLTDTPLKPPIEVYYVGIFLTDNSQSKLLQRCPPCFSIHHSHHSTVAFKPDLEVVNKLYSHLLGSHVVMTVHGAARDEKTQALSVSLPSWVPYLNPSPPHVTISVENTPAKDAGVMIFNARKRKRCLPLIDTRGTFKSRSQSTTTEWTDQVKGLPLLHGVLGVCLSDQNIVYSYEELLNALQKPMEVEVLGNISSKPDSKDGHSIVSHESRYRTLGLGIKNHCYHSHNGFRNDCLDSNTKLESIDLAILVQKCMPSLPEYSTNLNFNEVHSLVTDTTISFSGRLSLTSYRNFIGQLKEDTWDIIVNYHDRINLAALEFLVCLDDQITYSSANSEQINFEMVIDAISNQCKKLFTERNSRSKHLDRPSRLCDRDSRKSDCYKTEKKLDSKSNHPKSRRKELLFNVFGLSERSRVLEADSDKIYDTILGLSQDERRDMRIHQLISKTSSAAKLRAEHREDAISAKIHGRISKHHRAAAHMARYYASTYAYFARNLHILNSFKIDLHGLHVREALYILRKYVNGLVSLHHPGGVLLKIITGCGSHSKEGTATLLPAVIKELSNRRYLFDIEEKNSGMIRVLLS